MQEGSIWKLLIAENWKHYSKIIFKCVNSVVGPSFKVDFAKIYTCRFREQYTGSTQKNIDTPWDTIQTQPKCLFIWWITTCDV